MIRYGFNLSRFCFLWSFPSLKRHSGLWTISSCLATTQLDLWDCLTHGWFSLRKQRSTKGSYKESMDFPRMYRSAGSLDGAPFLTPRFVCFFTFYFVLGYIQLRRRRWHPTPVLLPGKSHGWGSLVGWSPWGRWESDTTERLHFHFPALEKEMATLSSVLAWRIPGTTEPGGLPSMGSHRVGHDWSDLAVAAAYPINKQHYDSFR